MNSFTDFGMLIIDIDKTNRYNNFCHNMTSFKHRFFQRREYR